MLSLYHCAGSRGVRALWTLEEMELPYELIMLPFPPRRDARSYLEVNPLGTVPALADGGNVLTESAGIAHYLATRYGPTPLAVRPDEPDYGSFVDFLHHGEATLTFPQTVYLRYVRMEPDLGLQRAGELYADWFRARLTRVRQRLQGRRYLCANRFTIADIVVAYALLLARKIGLEDPTDKVLSTYLELLLKREGYARVLAAEEGATAQLQLR